MMRRKIETATVENQLENMIEDKKALGSYSLLL